MMNCKTCENKKELKKLNTKYEKLLKPFQKTKYKNIDIVWKIYKKAKQQASTEYYASVKIIQNIYLLETKQIRKEFEKQIKKLSD